MPHWLSPCHCQVFAVKSWPLSLPVNSWLSSEEQDGYASLAVSWSQKVITSC